MRPSHRLLAVVTAAILLMSPLGVLAAHARCLADKHPCGKAVLVDGCCCDVMDARGIDPATTQSLPAAPPVYTPMADRIPAPATAAIFHVPLYPPLAGRISLNTLFAILLI